MQVKRRSRGFHTPDTCQITIRTIILGKTKVFFIWFKHIYFKSVYTIQYNFQTYKH